MPITLVCGGKKVLSFVCRIEIHAPATQNLARKPKNQNLGTGREPILNSNDANSRQVTTLSKKKIECFCYLRLDDEVNLKNHEIVWLNSNLKIGTYLSPLIDLRSFREVTEMHSFVYISKLNRVWCNK